MHALFRPAPPKIGDMQGIDIPMMVLLDIRLSRTAREGSNSSSAVAAGSGKEQNAQSRLLLPAKTPIQCPHPPEMSQDTTRQSWTSAPPPDRVDSPFAAAPREIRCAPLPPAGNRPCQIRLRESCDRSFHPTRRNSPVPHLVAVVGCRIASYAGSRNVSKSKNIP